VPEFVEYNFGNYLRREFRPQSLARMTVEHGRGDASTSIGSSGKAQNTGCVEERASLDVTDLASAIAGRILLSRPNHECAFSRSAGRRRTADILSGYDGGDSEG
jgi:hypothetical protein